MSMRFLSCGYVLVNFYMRVGGERVRMELIHPTCEHKARMRRILQMVTGRE